MSIDWEEVRNIIGWISGCAMAVAVAWAPVKCSMDGNDRIAAAIEAGVNPMDAKCAFSNMANDKDCAVRAAISGRK